MAPGPTVRTRGLDPPQSTWRCRLDGGRDHRPSSPVGFGCDKQRSPPPEATTCPRSQIQLRRLWHLSPHEPLRRQGGRRTGAWFRQRDVADTETYRKYRKVLMAQYPNKEGMGWPTYLIVTDPEGEFVIHGSSKEACQRRFPRQAQRADSGDLSCCSTACVAAGTERLAAGSARADRP